MASAWRSTNFALQKAIETLQFTAALLSKGEFMCTAAVPAPLAVSCAAPIAALSMTTEIGIFITQLASDISEQVYAEIVDGQDGDAAAEQDSAVYQNVITTHGNVIAVGQLVEQLLTIHGVARTGGGFSRRRLLENDCISMTLGNCTTNKPLCEDPTQLCDGSINYKYISQLKSGENDTC
jgi:hypothetical protein